MRKFLRVEIGKTLSMRVFGPLFLDSQNKGFSEFFVQIFDKEIKA